MYIRCIVKLKKSHVMKFERVFGKLSEEKNHKNI